MIEQRLNIENPTYSVVSYPGANLPSRYTALIFAKWLRSFLYGNKAMERKVSHGEYFQTYHKVIEDILKKPETVIRLAVLTDEPDVVLGFAVYRENVLDYLYVHRDQRQQGIGTTLIPSNITTITHMTSLVANIFRDNPKYKFTNTDDAVDPACRYFKFDPAA